MKRNKWLLLGLLLPIIALVGNVYWHHYQRQNGQLITLPIEGFDPRDLLSGHYLTYQVDYGLTPICQEPNQTVGLCLQPTVSTFSLDLSPSTCQVWLKGQCDNAKHFSAGIERFYIPEQYASTLDKLVRNHQGALVIRVNHSGDASIVDLLIDGKPWQQAVEATN